MKTVLPLLFLTMVLLLNGCAGQSPASRFYVLSPVAEAAPGRFEGHIPGVGPVRLPDYLERSQLVRRSSSLQLEVLEFDRWAGDLTRNVQDVLAANLSRLLGGRPVLTHPWDISAGVDRQVAIDMRRFEAGPGDSLVLELQWRISDPGSGSMLAMGDERIEVPVSGDTPDAMVEAQNQALAELSRRLASVLLGLGDG